MKDIETQIGIAQDIIKSVRRMRKDNGIGNKKLPYITIRTSSLEKIQAINETSGFIRHFTNTDKINIQYLI